MNQIEPQKLKEFEKEYNEVIQALFTKHKLAISFRAELKQSQDTGVYGIVVVPQIVHYEPPV
jgi:hypothetical protein